MKFFTQRAIYGVRFGCLGDIIREAGSHPDTSATEVPLFAGDAPGTNEEAVEEQSSRCKALWVCGVRSEVKERDKEKSSS